MPAAHGQAGLPSAPTPRLPTASDDPQHHKPRTPPGGQGCRPLHRPAWPCADPPTPSRPSQAHSGALVTHAPLPHAQPPQRTHRTAPQTPPDRTTHPARTHPAQPCPATPIPPATWPTRSYLMRTDSSTTDSRKRSNPYQGTAQRTTDTRTGTPREHNPPTEPRHARLQ